MLLFEEDVAVKLNSDEQKWIRNIVQDSETKILAAIPGSVGEAVRALRPQGWRKALHILREIAPLGGISTVVLALLAIVVTLAIATFNRREVEANFRGTTEEKLRGIDRQLTDLRALLASTRPERLQNQEAAKQLLGEARQKMIPPIPGPIVEQAGKSLLRLLARTQELGTWHWISSRIDLP